MKTKSTAKRLQKRQILKFISLIQMLIQDNFGNNNIKKWYHEITMH